MTEIETADVHDPEIPAIARELAPREPPVKADPVAQYDS